MNTKPPLITIVTATYNRSNVLYYSLSSLQKQDFTDWECVIVGDACTDKTESVVDSFNEKRFRFINLPENTGDQAGPNNYGCSRAKGKYIAFLNHDDLWFPDHLSSMINAIESSGTDLVYAMNATVFPDDSIRVRMIHETGSWAPHVFVPASSWLFKREMMQSVGLWHSFRQTHATPSQDWLFRAWKKKHRFFMNPDLTVILVFASWRDRAYGRREKNINESVFRSMKNTETFRKKIISDSMISAVSGETSTNLNKHLKKFLRAMIYKILVWLRLSPLAVLNFVRYGFHGGFIPSLSRKRGIEKKK